MKRNKALMAGIVAGIASPASIGVPATYQRLQGTDLDRLRGDAQRIGADFSTVIAKYGHTLKTPASSFGKAA